MTKIGLIGDPHANSAPVAEAIAIFQHHQVDAIWCTGDIAGYGEQLEETVLLLREAGCESILGNHEIWYLEKHPSETGTIENQYLNSLPLVMQQEIAGKRLCMVHASPPDSMLDGIRLLDREGNMIEAERQRWSERLEDFNYEVLIVGHTHQAFAEYLGSTLVINPGSSSYNHSCAILTLPALDVEWFALSGQAIQKSWNWGLMYR